MSAAATTADPTGSTAVDPTDSSLPQDVGGEGENHEDTPVAQQVFGNQASASQVERDFSGCDILLVPNRSRIDTYWVEMVIFLYVNFEHIPALKDKPMIAAKDIRACLPARFTGGG